MKQEVYRTANYAEVGSERGATVIPTERSIEEDLENTHTSPGHFSDSRIYRVFTRPSEVLEGARATRIIATN